MKTKERPILFSRPMVAALARGEKTQTRRIVAADIHEEADTVEWITSRWCGITNCGAIFDLQEPISCSFGAVGDHLWVREPWRVVLDDGGAFVAYSNGDELGFPSHDDDLRALAAQPNGARNRHARYMPRWASRFLLEIVSIRVERVQEISEEDALAEGVEPGRRRSGPCFAVLDDRTGQATCVAPSARESFGLLWESIHGPGAWERNEWVWVIEFKRVDVPGVEP